MEYYPDNSEWRDKLKKDVEEIERANKPTFQKTELEQISYAPPTDEDIKRWATVELNEDYAKNKRELEEKTDASKRMLAEQRDNYGFELAQAQNALEKDYQAASRATDGDAIKRGIARSSIAAINRAQLESEYLRLNADIAQTYGKKISELDDEINLADRKMQAALTDFNLNYAQKLAQKIDEMTAERDKKVAEIIKFNNEVKEKQAKLDAEREKRESETKDDSQAYQAVYDKMDEYLSGLEPIEARMELLNHSFYKEHLSNYYYGKLYNKYGRE